MYLISKEEMSEKLTRAWSFLSGVDVTFLETNAAISEHEKRGLTVVLPVVFQQERQARAMVIGLIIEEAEARRVASFLFGISGQDLTESDISDVCKESCNVLGGGLIFDNDNMLGLPQEISGDGFVKLQQSSNFNVTFTSCAPYEGQIILTILDVNDNNIWSSIAS